MKRPSPGQFRHGCALVPEERFREVSALMRFAVNFRRGAGVEKGR